MGQSAGERQKGTERQKRRADKEKEGWVKREQNKFFGCCWTVDEKCIELNK